MACFNTYTEMKRRKQILKLVATWLVFVVCLLLTKPSDLPFYLLFVPFVVLGFALYGTWKTLVASIFRRDSAGLSKKQKSAGLTLSIAIVLLLGMQSLGELTVRDFVTVVLFAVVFYFYSVRNLIRD